MNNLYLLGLSLLATTVFAHGTADTKSNAIDDLPMEAWPGYFIERCMQLDGGDNIELSFDSPYPIKLNIHFHTETTTEYLIQTVVTDSSMHSARTPHSGEYCYEVKNDEQRDDRFTVRMELNIHSD